MENEDGEKKEVVVKEIIKEVPSENNKVVKIKISKLTTLIIYCVIILLLVNGIVFGIKRVFKTQEKVLKLGLEDVGELVTQTCHTVVLEDSKESRYFFDLFEIPFTESRQIFSYDFDVDASIDFSKVNIESIDDEKKEIKVKLAHSKIFKAVLLPETFKSYLDSESLFSRIDLSEHNEALIKMEDIAKRQCLASELLNRADQNAQRLLSVMIKSEQKYKKYNVLFDYYDEIDNSLIEAEANEMIIEGEVHEEVEG